MSIERDENQHFFIYRSSAGSGKTHQLAVEFISLVIRNPNLFNKILAVTFTNKATKEMKERILAFLELLAQKKDEGLLTQIKNFTGLPEDIIAENAKLVTGKILHQYAQFSVSTIDAFFQKVVKSFAKELGLQGNYKVELDQDKIKQELIDQIIDDLGKDADLTDWLVEFSFSKVDDNKSRDIRPQIESLANEIFKESFRPVEEELQQIGSNDFKFFLGQVRSVAQKFEYAMKSTARKALELLDKHGLSVDDFSYKVAGPAGYFDRIIDKNDFNPKERVPAVLIDPEKWYTKNSPKKADIQEVIAAGLQELTASLIEYYQNNFQEYVTAVAVLKNFYVFGILSKLIQKLTTYRYENDVMLISDVPVFLKGIIGENEAPFIYEKTGSWYRHFLIDEFQDTSDFQWRNFKPLVENGLSQGNKSLLVGDGKQSIYRWRGGDWNLILNRVSADLLSWNPAVKHLSVNWRSSPNIVGFNNEVFTFLPSLLTKMFGPMIGDAHVSEEAKSRLYSMAADAEQLYSDVVQEVSAKKLSDAAGVIEITAYEKDAENSWKNAAADAVPGMIERLQDAGFRAKDIAILVRKSDEGKRVIERLIRHKQSDEAKAGYCYDAVSNESLFLGNASVVRLLINCIKYAQNPKDKIAFGEIAYYHRHIHGSDQPDRERSDLQFICDGSELPEDFIKETDQLIRRPVYEMTERLIQIFDLTDPQHKGYLQAFQDMLAEYFANESKDIHDFLIWWKDKGKRKSVQMPESINAIRVMTIHKSKGLEFKAVLVPFCDWNLDHEASKDNILWCRAEREPFKDIGYIPVKYGKNLKDSYFALEYFEEMIKVHIDNLNLLYVALTRAENFLGVNCPPISTSPKNAGDLLIRAMENMRNSREGRMGEVRITEEENFKKYCIGLLEEVKKSPVNAESKVVHSSYRSSEWRNKIAVRKKGGMFFGTEGAEKKKKINYGLLLHEILATIKNEKEAEALTEQFYREGQLSSEDRQMLNSQLQDIFSMPQVRAWFHADWKVKTEALVLTAAGNPKRPDRVLLKGQKAIIIDFKTGQEKQADRRQVQEYVSLLGEMGYVHVEGYLLYLAMNNIIKVA